MSIYSGWATCEVQIKYEIKNKVILQCLLELNDITVQAVYIVDNELFLI